MELTQKLALSWPTILQNVKELTELGLVRPVNVQGRFRPGTGGAAMLHEISFQSFNQRDQVQGWIYVPAAKPVGIIQLVHALLQAGEDAAGAAESDGGKLGAVGGDVVPGDEGAHAMAEEEIGEAGVLLLDQLRQGVLIPRPTSNRSFLYFCQMIDCITGPAWAEKVPKDLPVYNIAGGEDPVGQYGEGVKQVSAWRRFHPPGRRPSAWPPW